eukprot:COSAG04_NODE_490_length_13483_cov_5.310646_4_plen_175_part_00
MDAWAVAYKGRAQFICVGCMGQELSSSMGQEMKLANCVNACCDEGGMPSWGQLGCNGFIVLDSELRVVSPCTSGFMEVRELAFRHVESIVDALIAKQPVPSPCPGEFVRVAGLKKSPELNGQLGVCLSLPGDDSRVAVQLRSGRSIKAKGDNLVKVSGPDEDEGPVVNSSAAGG